MSNLYDNEIQHPSFGLINISRVFLGKGHYMCGSELQPTNVIRIVIEKDCIQGMGEHTGNHVFHGRSSYANRVEVEMTYSQFSNMICSLNMGEGTPCNVIHYGSEGEIEQYNEAVETKYEYNYKKVINLLKSQTKRYAEATDKIKELIDKLPKNKQTEILGILHGLEKSVTDSAPFFMKQCQEASEDIVNRAKTEVSNYVEAAVHSVGVAALNGGPVLNTQNLLTSTGADDAEDVESTEVTD